MVNTQYLEEEIKKSGLKKSFIAEKCGITLTTLGRKIGGKNEFTGNEIKVISKLLGFTAKSVQLIFFANDVHPEVDREGE